MGASESLRPAMTLREASAWRDAATAPADGEGPPPVVEGSIGHHLRALRRLGDDQMARIAQYQREHGVRFGDAAVALGLASSDDVLWALSQQFRYPYAAERAAATLDAELVTAVDPFSDLAELFRDVRSQLLMGVLAPHLPRCALAVLSPDRGDGKTFFAANLAVTLAQLGGRTLLIDADMRTPRLHSLLGVAAGSGLSSLLAERGGGEPIRPVPALPGLYLLPVGTVPPNPMELVQRPAFGMLVRALGEKFDHVIVDTPAASHGADARVIAAGCGAALLIGRQGRSALAALHGLIAHLGRAQVRNAGVLINQGGR